MQKRLTILCSNWDSNNNNKIQSKSKNGPGREIWQKQRIGDKRALWTDTSEIGDNCIVLEGSLRGSRWKKGHNTLGYIRLKESSSEGDFHALYAVCPWFATSTAYSNYLEVFKEYWWSAVFQNNYLDCWGPPAYLENGKLVPNILKNYLFEKTG